MRDPVIRAAFHRTILARAHQDAKTFVIDELGLKNGEIRADIAVLNGKMIGYEIKTDKDNLVRLPSQVSAYSDVFDKAYVIVGEKYIQKVRENLPEWWGVFCIKIDKQDFISFEEVKPGEANPQQNPYTIAQLLWKQEVVDLLQNKFNCVVKTSYTKPKLYEILVQQCSVENLSKSVLQVIKSREGSRKDPILLL